jgi:hypothetical protein
MNPKNCIVSVSNPCEASTHVGAYDITDIPNFSWGDLSKVTNNGTYQEAVKAHDRAYQNMKGAIQSRFRTRGGKFNFGYTQQNENISLSTFSDFDELSGVHVIPTSVCSLRTHLLVGIRIHVKDASSPKKVINFTVVTYINNEWITEAKSVEVKTNIDFFIPIDARSERDIFVYLNELLTLKNHQNVNGNSCGCGGAKKINMPCATFTNCTVSEVNEEFADFTNEVGNSPFSCIVSCGCDIDVFLCQNAEIVKMLFLAMFEKELLNLRLNNTRITLFALYGEKQAKERIAYLNQESDLQLNGVVESLFALYRDTASCGCIDCGKTKIKSSI